MRKGFFAVCLLVCPAILCAAGDAPSRRFGAGIILGSPTGISAKYRLGKNRAVDAALGFGDVSVHADYLWLGKDLLKKDKEGRLAPYWGLGAGLKDHKDGTVLGLRAVGGAAFDFPRHPVEIFLELAPVLKLTHDTGLRLDAGLGIRYYFK